MGRAAAAMRRVRRPALAAALIIGAACAPRAQVADTLAVEVDLAAITDTTEIGAERGLPRPRILPSPPAGRVVTVTPAVTAELHVERLLAGSPRGLAGAFLHDPGEPGLPPGLAAYGLDPRLAGLTLDGLPMDDLLDGRPRFDLLPFDVLAPVRQADLALGRPVAFEAATRPLGVLRPRTEIRYVAGQAGVQTVGVTHAQSRPAPVAGDDARLGVLFHAAGTEAGGVFAGGRRSGWRVYSRAGLARPGLSLDLAVLASGQRYGARTGVVPPAEAPFAAIYDPDRAEVLNPDATRTTERRDVSLTLRTPVLSEQPLTAALFWSGQTNGYSQTPGDTTLLSANRVGGRLSQALALPGHQVQFELRGWVDFAPSAGALGSDLSARPLVVATLRDSLALGGIPLVAEAGLLGDGDGALPIAAVRAETSLWYLAARFGGTAEAAVPRAGWTGIVDAQPEAPRETVAIGEAGGNLNVGDITLRLDGYGARHQNARHLTLPSADAGTEVLPRFVTQFGAEVRVGGTLGLDWRANTTRGLYATARLYGQAVVSSDSPGPGVPGIWTDIRIGSRAVGLFDGALDVDAAVQARAWDAFDARSLHAPTGIWTAPRAITPSLLPNPRGGGSLDVILEARLQERAIIHVALLDALAGTVYPGTFNVPGHPIPRRVFRFSVFWILFD